MSSTQRLVSSKGSIILKAVESHHSFLSSRMRGIWRRRDCRPDGHWETIALGQREGRMEVECAGLAHPLAEEKGER